MAWFLLILASIFEVGWPLGFKLSNAQPQRFWLWISLATLSMALSGILLYFAQRTIPVSTAYIVWTGLGALGTLIIGIAFFGDSASLARMFFALLVITGIIGLEITSK